MGGRGANSGVSDKGKPYGSEYTTVYKSGNIKFVKQTNASNAKTPISFNVILYGKGPVEIRNAI